MKTIEAHGVAWTVAMKLAEEVFNCFIPGFDGLPEVGGGDLQGAKVLQSAFGVL